MVLRWATTLPSRMYQMPRGSMLATSTVKPWRGVKPNSLGIW